MALREELEGQGKWLFRWRSYLPLLLIPLLFLALRHSGGLERVGGPVAAGVFKGFCVAISFAGLAVRGITVGYIPTGISNRNTARLEAVDVRTTGAYSIVRHPLYFGNFLIFLGVTLSIQVWWFVLIAALAFWLYYERIMLAEEEFLRSKFGEAYSEWATRTPAFFPRVKSWRRPVTPFSFRNVLRREYTGFFEIIAAFALLDFVGNWLAEGRPRFSLAWGILLAIAFVTYLTLRTLKKTTRLLEAGRPAASVSDGKE